MNPLLRDRVFRRYRSGQTISMFGDQTTSIALPLGAMTGFLYLLRSPVPRFRLPGRPAEIVRYGPAA